MGNPSYNELVGIVNELQKTVRDQARMVDGLREDLAGQQADTRIDDLVGEHHEAYESAFQGRGSPTMQPQPEPPPPFKPLELVEGANIDLTAGVQSRTVSGESGVPDPSAINDVLVSADGSTWSVLAGPDADYKVLQRKSDDSVGWDWVRAH